MKTCKIDGCEAPAKGRGWCSKHYARFRSHGDPLVTKRPAPKPLPDHCSVDGCPKSPYSLGLCHAHYTRQRRHGSPTEGRTPPGEPLRWLKSHAGYSGDDCLDWPFAKGRGYGVIVRGESQVSAPRMMCEMAHGPAPSKKHQTAHSCGKGHLGCINPKHLRWATCAENHADKGGHGTLLKGEGHPLVKLKESDVRRIKRMKGKATGADLAREYGVDPGTIYAIWKGKNWKWLE